MALGDTNVGSRPVKATAEEEFAAFEALPGDLRDVLNYAPVKFTATTVAAKGHWA
jgi:hypothetical protein